jgi:hypothetical protein
VNNLDDHHSDGCIDENNQVFDPSVEELLFEVV